jgi:hypothetical protein
MTRTFDAFRLNFTASGRSQRLGCAYWEFKMDVPVTEEQIRTLAFFLWEKDGGPEGRSEEYWEKARQQLGADTKVAATEEDASRQSDDPQENAQA